MPEHDEQVALMKWAALNERTYPELEMLYAIPNGGKRNLRVAQKLKAEGVKAGVWDLSLDVAMPPNIGMKIEMKFGKNKLTDSQVEWLRKYTNYGYYSAICYTWQQAAIEILEYLSYDIPEELSR